MFRSAMGYCPSGLCSNSEGVTAQNAGSAAYGIAYVVVPVPAFITSEEIQTERQSYTFSEPMIISLSLW
jgi:hypothetical protein